MYRQHILLVFFIYSFFITFATSYLQFKLIRIPHESKHVKDQPFNCPESLNSLEEVDYKQVCYDKDISYSFQIQQNDEIYYMSADLTTPLSWIKGKQCILDKSSKKCSLIEHNFKETVKQYETSIKKKIKSFHKKQSNKELKSRQKAQIQGSSNIIKGYLQKPQHLVLEIMNSNRFTRLLDIILLGFYILDEKDALTLESTKFINATQISAKLNYISDGAISLRFDENSENSFLNQIFDYTKAEQKIITLYLGENNYLALGELSLKYSQYGYSGINWVSIEQDDYFGKLPIMKSILIQDPSKQGHPRIIPFNKQAIITLSASYIGIHSQMIPLIQSKLSKQVSECKFEQHGFLKCTYNRKSLRDKDLQKRIVFDFNTASISLNIKDILLHEEGKTFVLNIKQIYRNQYIILGEPIFNKYTVYLDYGQQRIGFAIRRAQFQKQFINVVTLIRLLVFLFTFGCLFIICSTPCRVICNRMFSKRIVPRHVGKEGIRLKQYSPIIQENPYEQISQKIRSITTSKETTQVDGHPDDQI